MRSCFGRGEAKRLQLPPMNESLAHFLTTCRDAFAFLVSDYGFHEIVDPADAHNRYMVEFGNGDISLRVLGEGYGAVARVEYIAPDGRKVYSAILEPDWRPDAWRNQRKKRHSASVSQDDQIRAAARRIRARDQGILRGNYAHLLEAASRQELVASKLKTSSKPPDQM